jgi:hypothetical protein
LSGVLGVFGLHDCAICDPNIDRKHHGIWSIGGAAIGATIDEESSRTVA